MAHILNVTFMAHQNILDIYTHIKADSEDNAKKQMKLIYDKLENLADFPGMGGELSKKYKISDDYLSNLRYLVIGKSYIAFYEILDSSVVVYGVFSNRQDYIKKLRLAGLLEKISI